MRRTTRTVLTTAMISGLIVATPPIAGASDPAPLVRGTVTTAAGAAKAGATVHVFAEPVGSEKLKTGQSLRLKQIGRAVTDASGRYTVGHGTATDLRRYADSSGQVNLHLLVWTGRQGYTAFTQREVTRGGSAAKAATADIALKSPAAKVAVSGGRGAARPAAAGTIVKVVKDYGGRDTVVGTWYSDVKDVKHHFRYQSSAKSSLGVAVSASGRAGTFKAGRTKTQSATASVGFGTQKGKGRWQFKTQFHYQKRLYRYCPMEYTCVKEYRIEPVAWWGGATRSKAPAYSANHCTPMQRGTDWDTSNTKAWTFKAGVNTAGMTGVNLSSTSGYSKAVKHTLKFGRAARLCGTTDHPGENPGALRAKPSAR